LRGESLGDKGTVDKIIIRKAAVLGAGVMGAQIAAHLVNADVPVVLFDLAAEGGSPNAIVDKALAALAKLEPAPLAARDRLARIDAANYGRDLEQLRDCDLIIEAIAEKLEWKHSLYAKVTPYVAPGAIFASNTSGLEIRSLAKGIPASMRSRFCGVHFFNPPRYMSLVELIATADTEAAMLDWLEAWLTSRLGKNVVRARDTPNFVANRIGVFSILAVMHHTARLGLGFDEVDALTGPRIGRPSSATYRTADVVGLDTLAHVIGTMHSTLGEGANADPWHPYFKSPEWLQALVAKGALGQKTRAGAFRKVGKEIQVLDPITQAYRPAAATVAPEVEAILNIGDPAERFRALRASTHKQAQFLWAIFRDVFHYSAYHLAVIADNARDLDFAMRWGFGWAQGPFETWQAAGWRAIAAGIQADIEAGQAMAKASLPGWVAERNGVHEAGGSYSAASGTLRARSSLPVYGRQLAPERLVGESQTERGVTLWENEGVRLWQLPQQDARIGIVSFKTKKHTIGSTVLEGLLESINRAERELDGLVLWHEAPFSLGANLYEILEACKARQFARFEGFIDRFQRTAMKLKYAAIPTVTAARGMVLGGGCELALQTAHRVVALESYIGLVETGVGLIPAGGGCKELALQAADCAERAAGGDVFPYLQNTFQTVAMATVSRSALEAIGLGYVKRSDDVVFNANELLYVAIRRARALAEAVYRPPLVRRSIPVAGRNGIATCEMTLVNMKEGGMISEHDYRVARAAAIALCGGEVETGSRVDEQWLLDVERAQIVELLKTEQTPQRIAHTLATGKPLRN
jgi:3-hydroxyacyl-CoA dehydrogenase